MADYFRDMSVPEGERPVPFSADEFAATRARHRGYIVFEFSGRPRWLFAVALAGDLGVRPT
jgi:hypothetical protein